MKLRSLVVSLFLSLPSQARLLIHKGGGSVETFETAIYKFYGPQALAVNGTAVLLSDDEACNPERSLVEDQVVITLPGRDCDLGIRYERLNKAGAKAHINFVTWSPGIYTFRRHIWNPSRTQGLDMVMVSAQYKHHDGRHMDNDSFSGGVVTIEPPHGSFWEDYFSSPTWVCFIRIVVPLCAFWVSMACSKIAYRAICQNKELNGEAGVKHSHLAAWMSACEAIATFGVGAAYVLDIYGRMSLPVQGALFANTLFIGAGLAWSLVVALTIREEVRYVRDFTPRRSIWVAYKWTLRCAFVYGLLLDFLLPFRIVFPSVLWNSFPGTRYEYFTMFAFYSILAFQGCAASWFLYQVSNSAIDLFYLHQLRVTCRTVIYGYVYRLGVAVSKAHNAFCPFA